MQADAKQVDSYVANSDHHEAGNRNKSRTTTLPAATQPGMEIGRVHKPTDQSPGFFWIPAPVTSPGFIGPNGTTHDANGEHQKSDGDGSVAEAVQLFVRAELHGVKLYDSTFGCGNSPAVTTASDGTAPEFQCFSSVTS